ncbi:hypothetical protein M436DRAFT_79201 [Aureobasidium namibiae CBS 147.97]|uniref:Uncharacterized protein n=1 Tax=Aureobasidium namibiae CBS 147.97 TaxID=1043004 RepID=A0A074WRW6_9PEZI
MSSSAARPRASMMGSWFLTQPRLTYKEFYASFINVANKAWELSRRQERAPLEGLQKFIVELLQKERIPADELLTALQEYSAGLGEGRSRYKENGLVAFNKGLSHQALTAGKNRLQAEVQKDLRKVRNSLRVAQFQAAAAAHKATMATRQPLPAFVAPSSLPAYVAPSPLPGWLAPSSVPVHVPSPRSTELSWDPFVHREQLLSLQSVEEVIGDLGPAVPGKQAQKATTLSAPVEFGSLPLVGDKKAKGENEEKEEEMFDAEEQEQIEDEDMVL